MPPEAAAWLQQLQRERMLSVQQHASLVAAEWDWQEEHWDVYLEVRQSDITMQLAVCSSTTGCCACWPLGGSQTVHELHNTLNWTGLLQQCQLTLPVTYCKTALLQKLLQVCCIYQHNNCLQAAHLLSPTLIVSGADLCAPMTPAPLCAGWLCAAPTPPLAGYWQRSRRISRAPDAAAAAAVADPSRVRPTCHPAKPRVGRWQWNLCCRGVCSSAAGAGRAEPRRG